MSQGHIKVPRTSISVQQEDFLVPGHWQLPIPNQALGNINLGRLMKVDVHSVCPEGIKVYLLSFIHASLSLNLHNIICIHISLHPCTVQQFHGKLQYAHFTLVM